MRVVEDKAMHLMELSGSKGIYVQAFAVDPSDDAKFIRHPGFKPMWFANKTYEELLQTANAQEHVVGLARDRQKLGLIVKTASFEAVWKDLHEDSVEPPPDTTGMVKYKAEPFPPGADARHVSESLTSVWSCIPLRAMGRTAWLVAASSPPPDGGKLVTSFAKFLVTQWEDGLKAKPKVVCAGAAALRNVVLPTSATTAASSTLAPTFPVRTGPAAPMMQSGPVAASIEHVKSEVEGKINNVTKELDALRQEVRKNNQEIKADTSALRRDVSTEVSRLDNTMTQTSQALLHDIKNMMEKQTLTISQKLAKRESSEDIHSSPGKKHGVA
jgi:hypothetical protein